LSARDRESGERATGRRRLHLHPLRSKSQSGPSNCGRADLLSGPWRGEPGAESTPSRVIAPHTLWTDEIANRAHASQGAGLRFARVSRAPDDELPDARASS